ncbi:hypothetical protein ABII15_14755 [Streptomyces sp. HUAS MG91]|uniref:Gram-positive cocci surface proteins LPxTG domain-containing protein n=1 Tax=Streptomyces tabacisoli TaxID=3156398 RepID=A0AAU8ISC3_9ACTN
MRLRRPIALGMTATAAALALAAPLPATAHSGAPAAAREAACDAAADGARFPVDARIHPGPDTYHPGDGRRRWSIELTDTTGTGCTAVHPVLVLVDRNRELRPGQIRMEFHDGTRWRPVSFEHTDEDENIGVLDDGFPGFTVGAGRTVTVEIRLAFTAAARPGRVVADAAVVQRRGDDGDWVGESGSYPFTIADDDTEPGSATDGTDPSLPDQLAATGRDASLLGLGITACALLASGAALVLGSRRLRTPRY